MGMTTELGDNSNEQKTNNKYNRHIRIMDKLVVSVVASRTCPSLPWGVADILFELWDVWVCPAPWGLEPATEVASFVFGSHIAWRTIPPGRPSPASGGIQTHDLPLTERVL